MSFHDFFITIPIKKRYQFIRQFHQSFNNNINQTAIKLGISYNTVKKAVNTLEPIPRVYEKKVKDEHETYIYTQTILNPSITGEELSLKLHEFFGVSLTPQFINEIRRTKLNLNFQAPLRSVLISATAADKRKAWTSFHLDHNTSFRNVVFSDESWFILGRRKKWVWVDKNNLNEKMFTQTQAHPPKVMIWAGIGWNFKSQLVVLDRSVNSETYIDEIIFNSNVVEDADRCWGVGKWIFQQDNAPAHNSKETRAVLAELGITVLDWPPYSPDLNVIEVIWAIMEKRVEKLCPKNIEELKAVIIDVWNSITWQTIAGLICSMKDRLIAVNSNPGQTIYRLNSA